MMQVDQVGVAVADRRMPVHVPVRRGGVLFVGMVVIVVFVVHVQMLVLEGVVDVL
jgi:hypothetical protein